MTPPTERASVRTARVEHVGMMVPDIESSIDWYVGHLGFTVADRWANDDAEMAWAHLALGDFVLELVTRPGLTPPQPGSHGFHHLAIVVDDCTAVVAELASNGVDVVYPPSYFERHDMDWAFVHDNLKNVVEIVSYRTPTA